MDRGRDAELESLRDIKITKVRLPTTGLINICWKMVNSYMWFSWIYMHLEKKVLIYFSLLNTQKNIVGIINVLILRMRK